MRPVRCGVGGPTYGQARGPAWRRVSNGFYVPSWVNDDSVEQRILEASVRLRSYGAVTAWAGLRWHGAAFFTGVHFGERLPVPLLVGPAKLRSQRGIRVSQEQCAPHEFTDVDGVPCATPQRALFDEVRRLAFRDAVVAVDMTVAAGLLSVEAFTLYVATRAAWTGIPQVREILPWVSAESRSPQESRLRLVWVIDAGLPAPACNRPIFSRSGQFLGTPDLFDTEAGLVVEYDGADHRRPTRRRRDVARAERFRNHGLDYVEVVEGDLGDRPSLVKRLIAARRRALANAVRPQWTLETPHWWVRRSA